MSLSLSLSAHTHYIDCHASRSKWLATRGERRGGSLRESEEVLCGVRPSGSQRPPTEQQQQQQQRSPCNEKPRAKDGATHKSHAGANAHAHRAHGRVEPSPSPWQQHCTTQRHSSTGIKPCSLVQQGLRIGTGLQTHARLHVHATVGGPRVSSKEKTTHRLSGRRNGAADWSVWVGHEESGACGPSPRWLNKDHKTAPARKGRM